MTFAHSGDGWAAGPGGVPAWGLYGAAGLFLLAGSKVLLQHRATWTNQGDTWGIPGGARDLHESAADAALRETEEECGIAPSDVSVFHVVRTAGPYPPAGDLPGDWTYTTVLARTLDDAPLPTVANNESAELRWVELDEVESLPLLPAFRSAFSDLRDIVEASTA
ncbi:ADP-ribose pyrophosphatase [Corynebacterium camporealensis]|uniref:ADP-ribose pyrophosphatase n=2 Tax=Corynebacterium camporealensis TaxID=161896 RepID=A0A0F6TC49_9CORY|nr:NUDIX hydrolase [Corynebacterium camporealensis]AKE39989.1 ADP-ribose pyrophosphatase [Corynebacterium camporealensis]AVH89080.1 ADP-ribose pyrophosphatase [Corynebacterium camporealensis]